MSRLRSKKIVVRERSRPAKEVPFKEVDLPHVSKWYMTDEERLREARRIDGVEVVPVRDLGVPQPDRRVPRVIGYLRRAVEYLRS